MTGQGVWTCVGQSEMRLKYIFQETEVRHKNDVEMGYYRTENTFSIVVRKTDCYQQLKVGRRKSAFYCPVHQLC